MVLSWLNTSIEPNRAVQTRTAGETGIQGDHRHRVRIHRIGLATVPGGENRTCADSFEGTSTTSPAYAKRWAMCLPMPLQPSIAQTPVGVHAAGDEHLGNRMSSVPYRPTLST
jgi:hypothetical protein